ncbi:hypothetical protein [Alcanivorax sp. 1008]|uniref:hypothetical protein n=1 Tax=Alcanivorax sp. 1008 TaxID=2816853 RepID=UPI001D308C9C|nr:hypothetical protein [Alcanivorax sp. 1008]MCC1498045.1 hypothetical protein [Alcanivorax sp. 1008]
MDPKVEKNLADALEQLEQKVEPLQALSGLSETLKGIKGGLHAASVSLQDAAKPFPESLSALTRVSGLLADVSALIKNSDPAVIAEELEGVRKGLKSVDESIRNAFSDQKVQMDKSLDEIRSKIADLSKAVSEMPIQVDKSIDDLSKLLSGISDSVNTQAHASSQLLMEQIGRAKALAGTSISVSFCMGAVIIYLLLTASS